MTASREASTRAKLIGLKSLTQVSGMGGKPMQTLRNWNRENPFLFDIVLVGCRMVEIVIHQDELFDDHIKEIEHFIRESFDEN